MVSVPLPGVEAIAQERRRQIDEEGWTPEHDDAYENDELILAARCYLVQAEYEVAGHGSQPIFWPWHRDWWKPGDRRRNLVKAGALIAAEIDRLDREADRD